jgi:hypothetical protein
MINRYRTSGTKGNRNLRGSLMLLSQGIARLGNGIGMILCGDNIGFTHKPQGSNWLNTFAATLVQDSPRYAYAYAANVVVSEDSGEPGRAWSQGSRWRTKWRINS